MSSSRSRELLLKQSLEFLSVFKWEMADTGQKLLIYPVFNLSPTASLPDTSLLVTISGADEPLTSFSTVDFAPPDVAVILATPDVTVILVPPDVVIIPVPPDVVAALVPPDVAPTPAAGVVAPVAL